MTLIRPIAPEDKPLIESWIAAEPDHSNNTFEFYGQPSTKSVIHEDEEGPVFAVRYSSALRIDMEFNPNAGKDRIRAVLKRDFPEVARQAKNQGFSQLIFSSVSKTLIAFCRVFGFRTSPDFVRNL